MISTMHAEGVRVERSHILMAPRSLHLAGFRACNRGSLALGPFIWVKAEHCHHDATSAQKESPQVFEPLLHA